MTEAAHKASGEGGFPRAQITLKGDDHLAVTVSNDSPGKQGAGRLIRDVSDRGVLMICDPRLATKGYGRTFVHSLPAMPRTRNLADVQAFFEDGQ